MKRFTQSHEWVCLKDDLATVGISHVAQDQLGKIVYIKLPKVGEKLQAGKEVLLIESTKSAIDVYAPLSGTIVSVNKEVSKNPGLINRYPEKKGWIYQMVISNRAEFDSLMDELEYKAYISM